MPGPEYKQIAAALRKVLKGKNLTYEELGRRLSISSRTVKRIIHGEDYSVAKLAEVCEAAGIKFFDLMYLAQEEIEETFQLSEEQETYFASYPKHFKFFCELLDGLSVKMVRETHGLNAKITRDYVRDLESIGILERLAGDEVKLKVKARALNFIKNGPLDKAIGRQEMARFAEVMYGRGGDVKSFATSSGTKLTAKSIADYKKDLEDLAGRYRLIAQREESLQAKEEMISVRWLLAIIHPYVSWTDQLKL